MADPQYATTDLILRSRGLVARTVDDQPPAGEGYYALMTSLQEVEENALKSRFGTTVLSKHLHLFPTFWVADPLGGSAGNVHSISKLPSLNGNVYRYAGKGTGLYRLAGSSPGAYTQISNALSGNPWTAVQYNPDVSSMPYLFIADKAAMLKDNGTLSAPQTNGILQPQYPVTAASQVPDEIVLDACRTSSYTTTNVTSFSNNYTLIATNTTAAITATGIQSVPLAALDNISLYQSLVINQGGLDEETVLVLDVTKTGIVADFTQTHLTNATVKMYGWSGTPSGTGTVKKTFSGTPISAWPTTLDPEDYIALQLYVSDPTVIQSITIKFDCGDGSFTSDFFWRTIGQGPLQSFLNSTTDSSTAAADAVLSNTLGVYSSAAGGVTGLNTGASQWNAILLQLSDFSGTGRAAFDDAKYNWQNVNGYEIEIVVNPSASSPPLIQFGSLLLVGGAGPDSFAGVSYDYLFTFFNIVDYTESNPCMVMSDVDPPFNTNRVYPRRQPVLLTMTHPTLNAQTTHLRVYRRGGTLGDAYRRIDQIPCSGASTSYTDKFSDADIQGNDTVSFTNDVPLTSSLPVPVNTTLSTAISTTNQVVSVFPASMANISVSQQVDIGNVADANFEVVIVLTIASDHFTAYVQNTHDIGEPVSATAAYGVACDIIGVAFDMGWYAGDTNNPSYLYYSTKGAIQYVGSANYVPVSIPSDPVTAIVGTSSNLFVSTFQRWWAIAPGVQAGSPPTVYPTQADKGCVGKNAWCLREGVVYFLAVDGPRVFQGGSSKLISEIVQGVWQQTPVTPLPVADPTQFSIACVAYWNQYVIFSYVGLDGNRHRLVFDALQNRWRNDDLDAQSLFLEEDTNQLLFGDSQGLVHLDMQLVGYDEADSSGTVVQNPIAVEMQTPYSDQGSPANQKQFQEFTLDCNTNGDNVTAELLFNDGESSAVLGTFNTTQRQRFNFNLNSGLGYTGYKVALQVTGQSSTGINLYQAKIRSLVLALTRKSLDTYDLRFSDDGSKIAKNCFIEYTATAVVNGTVYYDNSVLVPPFTFTLPLYNGVRNSLRVRLPAVKFRILRMVLTSAADFQVWETSRWEVKGICQGKGYGFFPLMP